MHDLDRTLQTLEPEAEFGAGEYEMAPEVLAGPGNAFGEKPLSAEAETALATELLAVTNEAELEQFIDNFMYQRRGRSGRRGRHRLRRHFRRFVDYGAMQPAPPPPVLVADDQVDPGDDDGERELEGARRSVRLAAAVAKKAADDPPEASPGAGPAAARVPAAGASQAGQRATGTGTATGRWVRHGRKIVLLGV